MIDSVLYQGNVLARYSLIPFIRMVELFYCIGLLYKQFVKYISCNKKASNSYCLYEIKRVDQQYNNRLQYNEGIDKVVFLKIK